MSKKKKKRFGWICPICNKVNGPHIDSCNCQSITWHYVPWEPIPWWPKWPTTFPYDTGGPIYSTTTTTICSTNQPVEEELDVQRS